MLGGSRHVKHSLKVKYTLVNEIICKSSYLTQYMEEDIQNYSPAVMFRGTPCISAQKVWSLNIFKYISDISFNYSKILSFISTEKVENRWLLFQILLVFIEGRVGPKVWLHVACYCWRRFWIWFNLRGRHARNLWECTQLSVNDELSFSKNEQ